MLPNNPPMLPNNPSPRIVTPPRPPKNIPFIAPKGLDATPFARDPNKLPPDEAYSGRFRHSEDGEDYALAIVPDNELGTTHKLKNSIHFFECDEKEFKLRFTPVVA